MGKFAKNSVVLSNFQSQMDSKEMKTKETMHKDKAMFACLEGLFLGRESFPVSVPADSLGSKTETSTTTTTSHFH